MNRSIDSTEDWRTLLNHKYKEPEYQQLLDPQLRANQNIRNSRSTSQDLIDSSTKYHGLSAHIPSQNVEELQGNQIADADGGDEGQNNLLRFTNPYAEEYHKKLQIFQSYEAIRFPPVPKLALSPTIEKKEYILPTDVEEMALKLIQENPEFSNVQTSEAYAGIQFLESMLLTFVEKLDEIRKLIVEHGNYLYSLNRPPEEDDGTYINTVIMNNLAKLKTDLQQLLEDMTIFQPHKVEEMVHNDNNMASNRDIFFRSSIEGKSHPIQILKQSIISRGMKLNDEITISILNVDQLKLYSLSLVNYPNFPVTKFAGFHTYWNDLIRLQQKQKVSRLSLGFKAFMSSRDCPVNNIMFQYLQSPKDYANLLIFDQYQFEVNEFSTMVQFILHEFKLKLHLQEEKKHHKQSTEDGSEDVLLANNSPANPKATEGSAVLKSKLVDLNPFSQYFNRPFDNGTVAHSIHALVLFNANICDLHCYHLSTVLPKLVNLKYFDLSYNNITYSGIASLVTAVFENKLFFKDWILDRNRLNSDAAILLGQAFDYLPTLERFSINDNPIKDQGCYGILQACLNKFRRRFQNLPVLDRTKSESEIPREEFYHEGEEEEIIEEELTVEEEAEEVVLDQHGKSKRRFPKNCYFQDYFSGYLSRDMLRLHQINQLREAKRHHYQWVNLEQDEFEMDIPSEYSYHEEIESAENHMSYQEMLQQTETLALSQIHEELSLEDYIASYPKFVKLVLKLRVKLASVAMFLKLRRRGHKNLKALSFANCGISSAILPMLSVVFLDNIRLIKLNISKNKNLLANESSCTLVADVIQAGNLKFLDVSETDLKDAGLFVLAQAVVKNNNFQYFNLSHNNIGPTGANIIANLAKDFGLEDLSVSSGKVRSAPFPMRNYPWSDVKIEKGRVGRGSVASASVLTHTEDEADDDSFVDTDLFDGDGGDEDETMDNDDYSSSKKSRKTRSKSLKSRNSKHSPELAPKKSKFVSFLPKVFFGAKDDADSSLASKIEML